MYGGNYFSSKDELNNEVAISNIIAIINIPGVWNKLDDETKEKVYCILAAYVKGSVKNAYENRELLDNMPEKIIK